ncbi:alanyl-tRNA editing protein [Bartonella sp. HY761]|uniref:alanyl-tRNA editing protein n=1 Tax=Bartonella sp. HY761 TaxID=2979330 RepID=UPI0021FAE79E|nr:alanyl-tRNA editing protein [Bartonella sp. HY761]UXN07007.1 alanyl-tRNA editing protein [Bartonella sp. HY761]
MVDTLKLHINDAYLKQCEAKIIDVFDNIVVLDQTIFYAESGGQLSDRGEIVLSNGTVFKVEKVIKSHPISNEQGVFHIIACDTPLDRGSLLNLPVICNIDWAYRYNIMKMHSAAHLLCAILPYPVNGCQISDTAARLDFVTTDAFDKDLINGKLSQYIEYALEISQDFITNNELAQNPQLVRTLNAAPPQNNDKVRLVKIADIDIQPCGGTHVNNTSEIGKIEVAKTKKVSAECRRLSVGFVA